MIAVIILAAGAAERMGRPKQLLPWTETTLLGHAVDVARRSVADQVVVVLGCQADLIRRTVNMPGVCVVVNEEWPAGLASSVRTGLAAVPNAAAVVFMPCDQPGITSDLVNRVIATHQTTGRPIVMVRCGNRRGPPALFARRLFPALQTLAGDQGGRQLLEMYPDQVAWVDLDESAAACLADVDTPADYQALFHPAASPTTSPEGKSATQRRSGAKARGF